MKAWIDVARCAVLRSEGMTYVQIAETIGCSNSAAYCALNKARVRETQRRADARRRATEPAYLEDCRARARRAARRRSGMKNATSETKAGPCEICSTHQAVLRLDHDHATGEIRGWLCTSCNRGLGYLKDTAENLRKALAYLERK